jgi:hypothetical protein
MQVTWKPRHHHALKDQYVQSIFASSDHSKLLIIRAALLSNMNHQHALALLHMSELKITPLCHPLLQ